MHFNTQTYLPPLSTCIKCVVSISDLTDQASWDKVEFWVKELQVAAEVCIVDLHFLKLPLRIPKS